MQRLLEYVTTVLLFVAPCHCFKSINVKPARKKRGIFPGTAQKIS